jgi:neopullulanase
MRWDFQSFKMALMAGLASVLAACSSPAPGPNAANADRLPQDDIVYFMLPDRFANGDPSNDQGGRTGDRMVTGFDPTDAGFYQGGDLKGLTAKLDYIEALGATAIWLGPVYVNKPVQGDGENASAGYHGYWITDFLNVDPHFGTNADMKAFVDGAHARGMKVYLDIILNHTADVIAYRECPPDMPEAQYKVACAYRPMADYPFTRRGGLQGEAINEGFTGTGETDLTPENFAKLTRFDWALTPYIPPGEEKAKNPAWLNDIRYYNNRGDTTFRGENSLYGDFNGLDDLMTEHPKVRAGMIEIFKHWITTYRVDGFRIDTIKHTRPSLWQEFIPAMQAHARSLGIANFYMFGEAYDFNPAALARYTREDGMPAVLDFAFQGAVRGLIVDGKPARDFEALFAADVLYANGKQTAAMLPTFLSNHDMGRMATFLSQAKPKMADAEKLQRLMLGHAILFYSRGTPVIYSGDEQGFNSDSNDRHARETLFPSRVASWNDNDLIGTDRTNAQETFDTTHPLFLAIAGMAEIRKAHRTLRRGEQIVRYTDETGGVLALSRLDRANGEEYVIVFNAETKARTLNIVVEGASRDWVSVRGACKAEVNATASYNVSVGPLDFVICRARRA